MTLPIYDAHDKAFANVSAWVILDAQGVKVASVAIKYGARATAFTHFIGVAMTRGGAGGSGYDRTSAAIQDGFAKATTFGPDDYDTPESVARRASMQSDLDAFRQALNSHDGYHWYQNLERAGYRVLQAV